MSSLKTRRRLKSGNHGSDSSEQSVASGVQGTFSTAPQQSTKVFVPPVIAPVKTITKIKDVLSDPELVVSSSQPTAMEQTSASTETLVSQDGTASTESQEEKDEAVYGNSVAEVESEVAEVSKESIDSEAVDTSTETETTQNNSSADEKFVSAWNNMFELLFREIATIYYPLKDVIPPVKNNIIYLKVKNEMMKDNFESRIRLALEYLRKNYDPRIDDIVVEVDTSETPATKLIYDTQDKMNDLRRENQDLPEFLKILNLSAKDM